LVNGWFILEAAKLIPAKLVVGGFPIYRPATIEVVPVFHIPASVVPLGWKFTKRGQVLEKVLFAGVKRYDWFAVSTFPTVILTVPVLTHKRSWASNRFTKPILFRLSNK